MSSACPAPPLRSTARLFLALCPGSLEQQQLSAYLADWQWPAHATPYAPADWHVTLHFIGAVPLWRLDALRAALAVPMSPFTLSFGQPELWPHGLAVLMPLTIPEPLQQLHDRLGLALRDLGLKTDSRPYHPHLTLARQAAQAHVPSHPCVFNWAVHGYALMESTGDPKSRYRLLQRFEHGGSA